MMTPRDSAPLERAARLACLAGLFLSLSAHAQPDQENHIAAKPSASLPGPTPLFLSQLTFYERNYFITGFSLHSQAKFQLSLKYNLWPNNSPHAVYVGYTQLSLWNIYSHSGPFTEINFSPMLFHEYRVKETRGLEREYCGPAWMRLALDHSSNGLGGWDSRAFNRISSKMAFGCYGPDERRLELDVHIWPPLIFDREQEDLEQFIGYGELTLQWRSAQSHRWYGNVELATRVRKGAAKAITRGTVIVEGAWNPNYGPATAQIWRFTPYVFAQFFTGYYDSLSTYDVEQTHFRIGLGLNDGADGSR